MSVLVWGGAGVSLLNDMDLVQVGQNYYQTQVENQRWQAEE